MIDDSARPGTASAGDGALRESLARDEAMGAGVAPILRHLLASEDRSIFSDEVVARVRGMLTDLSRQLLDARHSAASTADPGEHDPSRIAALSDLLLASPALLRHVHALALEWQLTERLQQRHALDPVIPPLVQALIASPTAATAEPAMQFLAAQARFGQAQRRMRLPLVELPADLLHAGLIAMRAVCDSDTVADGPAAAAETAVRARYDESHGRLGLISRLVMGMGGGAVAALSVTHAGVPVFLTALALGSGQDRDAAVLAASDVQPARLAVMLRAAGLKPAAVEEQFLAIHPDLAPPEEAQRLSPERAAALLAEGDHA